MTERPLPWTCPEHPYAEVRHTWTRTRHEVSYGANRPRVVLSEDDSGHRYECSTCGRALTEEPTDG